MNVSDDDLDRLFRAANPVPQGPADTDLSARHIAIREGIIRGSARHPARRARRALWAGLTTATAVVAVGILVAVNVLTPSGQAAALAPPPLVYTEAGSLDEVVADAETALRVAPAVEQSASAHSVIWGWNIDMESAHIESIPQDITFTWSAGEGGTTTVVAAETLWSDGDLPAGVEPSPYETGDLISELVTPPESLGLPPEVEKLTGSTTDDLEVALGAFGATPESTSGEMLTAIAGLMGFWTLSNEQHAALLELLVDAGDVTVLGETTDRLGRDVIGLRVSSAIPERVETVFVSVDTGRIVGFESELIAPLDPLPAGVISYEMWDASN